MGLMGLNLEETSTPNEMWGKAKSHAREGKSQETIAILEMARKEKTSDPLELQSLANMCLTCSIESNQTATALALLEYGADPSDCEELALRLASSLGNEPVVLKCIEKGANPLASNSMGHMILNLAIERNHENIIKVMMPLIQKETDNRSSPKDIIESANKAMEHSNTVLCKELLSLLKNKELTSKIGIASLEVKPIINKIISQRRKERAAHLLEDHEVNI
jgi:hypothetical protein